MGRSYRDHSRNTNSAVLLEGMKNLKICMILRQLLVNTTDGGNNGNQRTTNTNACCARHIVITQKRFSIPTWGSCQFLCTITVTSAECERSISVLKTTRVNISASKNHLYVYVRKHIHVYAWRNCSNWCTFGELNECETVFLFLKIKDFLWSLASKRWIDPKYYSSCHRLAASGVWWKLHFF